MAAVGHRDTAPELTVRRYLHARGLRFRVNVRSLPGSPDIVLKRHRAVVFVHGCYWHRHAGCRRATWPKTNLQFWTDKFGRNRERDRRCRAELMALGWQVIVVWECQAKRLGTLSALARRILGR